MIMRKLLKWLHSQPIRNKVLAFGILMSSIPLLLLSYYYFTHTKTDLETRINEKQILVLNNLTTEIKLEMEQTFQHLQMLTLLNQNNENSGFYELLQQSDSIEEIVITDSQGLVEKRISRYNLNLPGKNEKWFSDDMWYNFQTKEKIYGEVEFNQFGQPVMKLAVPFIQNGERKGIGVTVQLQKIIGKISSLRQDHSSYLYLMDKNGRVIAHQDYSKLWQKPLKAEKDSVLGVREKIPGPDWTLVMEQPKTSAYEPINKMLQDGFLVFAIVTLIISLISIYAGLYFTKPIMMLDKAMKKLKLGETFEPLELQQKDEMGMLVQSFNGMSQELQDKTVRLEQEKERLNLVLNGIGAGLGLLTNDYRITWMNPLLKKLLDEEQVKLPCYALFGATNTPCEDCMITCPEITGNADRQIVFTDGNGIERIYRHRVFPLNNKIEGEGEYLLFIEDITEQKEMEEKMVQTDKIAALGLMASSFAHEVNNPLTTINVYAEDLLDRIGNTEEILDDEEISYYLKKIKDNTIRCKKITNSLLNFSRKKKWTASTIDINETIQEAISLVKYTLNKKNIKLQVDIAPDIPAFTGDGLKLMQVLVNLLNNSIDALTEEGTITISVKKMKEYLQLLISDTGEGIPKEMMAKIFDPFFTTKPVGKGTGLGLSVCYGIIQQFGGVIHVISEQGMGTTVEISIPLSKKDKGDVINDSSAAISS
jgi:two-component system, NtrC family, sensor kinase